MNTIVVTGANGDIGSAIIDALLARGERVIGVVRDDKGKEEVSTKHGIETFCADLGASNIEETLSELLPETFDWLITAHGYIDPCTDPMEALPEDVLRTFEVNALSQMYLAQLCIPRLNHGMICISSTAGLQANGKVLAYSASKAAANAFMQGLARNKPEKTFIALCPGPTVGRMRARIGAEGGQSPELVARACVAILTGTFSAKSGDIITVKDGEMETVSHI